MKTLLLLSDPCLLSTVWLHLYLVQVLSEVRNGLEVTFHIRLLPTPKHCVVAENEASIPSSKTVLKVSANLYTTVCGRPARMRVPKTSSMRTIMRCQSSNSRCNTSVQMEPAILANSLSLNKVVDDLMGSGLLGLQDYLFIWMAFTDGVCFRTSPVITLMNIRTTFSFFYVGPSRVTQISYFQLTERYFLLWIRPVWLKRELAHLLRVLSRWWTTLLPTLLHVFFCLRWKYLCNLNGSCDGLGPRERIACLA